VILPADTKRTVLEDLEDFLSTDTESFYAEHGIPYKRNYLFYGVPGSGKTSLIQALAGSYQRNVCYLHPTHPLMTDDSLQAAMADLPNDSVVVFEDVDALFDKSRNNKVKKSVLTFSGLLNALDGIGNPQGQICILTTNFREQLDDALIRNGRVDMQVRFEHASSEQIVDMFRAFRREHQDCAEQFADELVRLLAGRRLATASLQHFFVKHRRGSVEELFENIGDVVVEHDKRFVEEVAAARSSMLDSKM
jgi:chaperone BCS1